MDALTWNILDLLIGLTSLLQVLANCLSLFHIGWSSRPCFFPYSAQETGSSAANSESLSYVISQSPIPQPCCMHTFVVWMIGLKRFLMGLDFSELEVPMIEFCSFTSNSSSSRCLIGQLCLFECVVGNCNTKN